jgi:16S rRNA (adenine1518-N6/adenine1519-N6)-dimethyltransferase
VLTVSELKVVLSRYGIRPKKYLGQNFLVDRKTADEMIGMCRLENTDWVLEIGPGLGALTRGIALEAEKVIAVEKDRRVYAALSELMKAAGNIEIICEDFLKLDLTRALSGCPPKIKAIGNLPYYITSPIIEKLIINRGNFSSVFVTVQKEVGERICAKPGGKDYGSFSCFAQFHARPAVLLNISKRAFYPQPAVDSVFMELSVLPKPPVEVDNIERFFAITRAAFGKRRKTILNSLSYCASLNLDKNGIAALLERAGVKPAARAEVLSLEDFARICNAVKQ